MCFIEAEHARYVGEILIADTKPVAGDAIHYVVTNFLVFPAKMRYIIILLYLGITLRR